MRPSGNPPWANRMRITSAKLNAIEEALKAFESVDTIPAPGFPGRVVRYNGALYLDQGQSWEALVFLSQLTAHTGDTNNPHNVQAVQVPYISGVSGFTPTSVKAALDALAGVRIVEMGSNANGEYVRWENGLQICMAQRLLLGFANANHMFVFWTLPAAFVAADYVPLALYDFNDGDTDPHFVKSLHARNKSKTIVRIDLMSSGMFTSSDIRHVSALAIGRWK